ENVDLYIGGSEHATGHLLYSRFWTKFLYDRGMVTVEEPFKKLINQGMILGQSAFVYRINVILDLKDKKTSEEEIKENFGEGVFTKKHVNQIFVTYGEI